MEDIELIRIKEKEKHLRLFIEKGETKLGDWHVELRDLSRFIQNYEASKARLLQMIDDAQSGRVQVTIEELEVAQANLPPVTEREYARKAELESAITRLEAKKAEYRQVQGLLNVRRSRVMATLRQYERIVAQALFSHPREAANLKVLIVWYEDRIEFLYGGREKPEGLGHGKVVISSDGVVSVTPAARI